MASRHVKDTYHYQIRTTMRYHLTPIRMAIIKMSTTSECWKGYGEKRTLYTVGGNVSWCSHYKKQYGGYSEN